MRGIFFLRIEEMEGYFFESPGREFLRGGELGIERRGSLVWWDFFGRASPSQRRAGVDRVRGDRGSEERRTMGRVPQRARARRGRDSNDS